MEKYIEFYQQKSVKGCALLFNNLVDVANKFHLEYFEVVEALTGQTEPHVISAKEAQQNLADISQYLADYFFLKKVSLTELSKVFGYSNVSNCHKSIKKNIYYRQYQWRKRQQRIRKRNEHRLAISGQDN